VRAEIAHLDESRHAVFGLIRELPEEEAWFRSVMKSCPPSGACQFGQAKLIECCFFDREKVTALGVPSGPRGAWLGLQVPDAVFQRVAVGQTFRVDLDSARGLQVNFDLSQQERTSAEIGGFTVPEETGVFVFSKNEPEYGLVAKCAQAVRDGDVRGLSRECFSRALDAVAKSFATQGDMDFHSAYAQILNTPLGGTLYGGYCAARPAPPERATVTKSNPSLADEAWQNIDSEAEKLLERTGFTMTKAEAINNVLREKPELYSAYDRAVRIAAPPY